MTCGKCHKSKCCCKKTSKCCPNPYPGPYPYPYQLAITPTISDTNSDSLSPTFTTATFSRYGNIATVLFTPQTLTVASPASTSTVTLTYNLPAGFAVNPLSTPLSLPPPTVTGTTAFTLNTATASITGNVITVTINYTTSANPGTATLNFSAFTYPIYPSPYTTPYNNGTYPYAYGSYGAYGYGYGYGYNNCGNGWNNNYAFSNRYRKCCN